MSTVQRTFGANILASPAQVAARAAALTGAHPEDQISVAGPDGLEAMVSLCRLGFDKVECAIFFPGSGAATCRGADEASDLLLIAGPMTGAELAQTVARTARLLREDGALAIQISHAGDEAAARVVLASLGLEATATLTDRACGRLAVFTVRRRAGLRAVG